MRSFMFWIFALASLLAHHTPLFSAEIVYDPPLYLIEGARSRLNHPEGLAFSPTDTLLAVANARSNNILFYRFDENDFSSLSQEPLFIIDGKKKLFAYPHDVSFSPDGKHLAVVSSYSNRITIHERLQESGSYSQQPIAVIEGKRAGLINTHTVKYSPSGNTLAVCDVTGHKIALYRKTDDSYEPNPYQILSPPSLIMDRPDGVAFSRDGTYLGVTSHGNHSVLIFQQQMEGSGLYDPQPVQILKGPETTFHYTHSLSFHPVDDTLVVSSASGKKTLAAFLKLASGPNLYSTTPNQVFEIFNPLTFYMQMFEPEEGGLKGVAFTPSGRVLAVLATDIGNPQRSIIFYAVE